MSHSGPEQLVQFRIAEVMLRFPFRDRDNLAQEARTREVATRFLRWCPPPAKVADLGTGQALLPGVLAALGYEAMGVDDYEDPVHDLETVQAIEGFARSAGFKLVMDKIEVFVPARPLDAACLVDVIEHLHASPRVMLNHVGEILRPGGFLAIVMPNSVNARKRMDVLRGRTNYPPLREFFHSAQPWRGHVREYTPREGGELLGLLGFEVLEVQPFDAIFLNRVRARPLRFAYGAITGLRPALKDSFLALGRKPAGWMPPPNSKRVAPGEGF